MVLAGLKTILVPTDFTQPSELALEAAIEIGRVTGAALEILHVNIDPTFVVPPPGDILAVPIDLSRAVQSAIEQLDATVARATAQGLTARGASESGRTHTEIVDHARKVGAGLIVMGTHGRHGIGHALLGSVAEKVVQNASCPVLVVPMPVPARGPV
jgi:nucleotide-binding universal stress UspA family protein